MNIFKIAAGIFCVVFLFPFCVWFLQNSGFDCPGAGFPCSTFKETWLLFMAFLGAFAALAVPVGFLIEHLNKCGSL
jgi:hypothetical protein